MSRWSMPVVGVLIGERRVDVSNALDAVIGYGRRTKTGAYTTCAGPIDRQERPIACVTDTVPSVVLVYNGPDDASPWAFTPESLGDLATAFQADLR